MKQIFKILDFFAPGMASKIAYRFMSNPRVRKLRGFEEDILAKSTQNRISFKEFQVQSYAWGKEGNPIALLVHGWEGQSGNFGNLIDLLIKKGYQIVAYDAPSHGKSSKGATSMFEYTDFITERIKVHKPAVIISHSFGSITTLLGLRRNAEFFLNQWIIVTTPFNFQDRIDQMKEQLGFTNRTVEKLVPLLEQDTEYTIEELNVGKTAPQLNNLGSSVIIHSQQDKVIPIGDARKVHRHLANSEMIELKNLGHYRILWSEELKEIIDEKIEEQHTT